MTAAKSQGSETCVAGLGQITLLKGYSTGVKH